MADARFSLSAGRVGWPLEKTRTELGRLGGGVSHDTSEMIAGHWNFGGGAGKAPEKGRETPAVEQQRRMSSWRWVGVSC